MTAVPVDKLAEVIARSAHAGQQYNGLPYVDAHVAIVVQTFARIYPEHDTATARAVAWLHDVIEDCAITGADLRDAGVPREVVSQVRVLTRPVRGTYADYITAVAGCAGNVAPLIKVADLLTNAVHVTADQASRAKRYARALRQLSAFWPEAYRSQVEAEVKRLEVFADFPETPGLARAR